MDFVDKDQILIEICTFSKTMEQKTYLRISK